MGEFREFVKVRSNNYKELIANEDLQDFVDTEFEFGTEVTFDLYVMYKIHSLKSIIKEGLNESMEICNVLKSFNQDLEKTNMKILNLEQADRINRLLRGEM